MLGLYIIIKPFEGIKWGRSQESESISDFNLAGDIDDCDKDDA